MAVCVGKGGLATGRFMGLKDEDRAVGLEIEY